MSGDPMNTDATTLSSHVLDLVAGGPAVGVQLRLDRLTPDGWQQLWSGVTDDDGRARPQLDQPDAVGTFRLTFQTGAWRAARDQPGFYPHVPVVFEIHSPGEHYHVPLLMGPYGYSTYRGS